jgi:small GTP-binding protein
MQLNKEKKDILKLKELIESLKDFTPTIVCTGLLNAGKSTLLNALIGDNDNQTFKVADIRETTAKKQISVANLTYIDTPGLDANDNDTKVVYEAINSADIVLFVHNINTGELDKSEVTFLKDALKHHPNPKDFLSTIIFVLTKKDNLDPSEEEHTISEISKKIEKQIQDIFIELPIIVVVSAEVYQEALKENSPPLLQYSNVSTLKKHIDILINEHKKLIYNNKQTKIRIMFRKTIEQLKSKRQNLIYEKHALMMENEQKKNLLKQDIVKLNKTLKEKEKNYKGL